MQYSEADLALAVEAIFSCCSLNNDSLEFKEVLVLLEGTLLQMKTKMKLSENEVD